MFVGVSVLDLIFECMCKLCVCETSISFQIYFFLLTKFNDKNFNDFLCKKSKFIEFKVFDLTKKLIKRASPVYSLWICVFYEFLNEFEYLTTPSLLIFFKSLINRILKQFI